MKKPDIYTEIKSISSIFKMRSFTLINVLKLTKYFSFFSKKSLYTEIVFNPTNTQFFIKVYLQEFLKNFLHISYKADYADFNYFIVKETRRQSFVSLLNSKKQSQVTYSTGLLLCAMGLKNNNVYKSMKKQSKGFIKGFNFAKSFVIPKFFNRNQKILKKIGFIIKGRGKFTTSYSELPSYFKRFKTETLFLIWVPSIRFSYIKFRQYGRIKRNVRKRIVKSLTVSDKLKTKANYINVG